MAPFRPTNILVFGGTGTIGRYITSALLSSQPRPFASLTLFTSPNPNNGKTALLGRWKAAGVKVIEGSIKDEGAVEAAYRAGPVDTVISALGRGALGEQELLLRLAEASDSVQWFLPSEFGTDIAHGPASAQERPHQLKLKVRAYVAEHVKRVRVTYVVTGPYFDMWVDTAPGAEAAGGFDAKAHKAWVVDDGRGKVGFCTMRDVGKFVVATLRHPEASFGKALKVQSFIVTPREVLLEYERQTEANWVVSSTSVDELRALESKLWDEGSPRATGVTLRRIWAEGGTLYDANDNSVVGVTEGDLDTLDVAVKKALGGGWKGDEF